MENFKGKVAFVTGAASGIGLGMAKAFLKAGMKVAIADIREDRLENAVATLKQISDDVLPIELDVRDKAAIERAADQTEAAFDKVHVVCNNAGIGLTCPFLESPEEKWEQLFDINYWGAVRGNQVFIPRIQRHGEGGHIVNTSSLTGMCVTANQPIYGSTKFAVVGLTEFLQHEYAEQNISFSVLCPLVVDTAIFHTDLEDADVEGIVARRGGMARVIKIAVDPEVVGEQVLRGIQNEELYIFCDGKYSKDLLKKRTDAILAAIERQFPE